MSLQRRLIPGVLLCILQTGCAHEALQTADFHTSDTAAEAIEGVQPHAWLVTAADIERAAANIAAIDPTYIPRALEPLAEMSAQLTAMVGRPVHVLAKIEGPTQTDQGITGPRTKAYKIRGVSNAVAEALRRHAGGALEVVGASTGNHATSLAWVVALMQERANAAGIQLRGTIVVPAGLERDAPAKFQRLKAAAGTTSVIVPFGDAFEAAYAHAQELTRERNGVFIPPFAHADVVAGNATMLREVLAERPDVDLVVVPVGGGGLIAGTANAARVLTGGRVHVLGMEPANTDMPVAKAIGDQLAPGRPALVKNTTQAQGAAVYAPDANIVATLLALQSAGVPVRITDVTEGEIGAGLHALARANIKVEGAGALAAARPDAIAEALRAPSLAPRRELVVVLHLSGTNAE